MRDLLWLCPMYSQAVRVKGAGFWLTVPTGEQVAGVVFNFWQGGKND